MPHPVPRSSAASPGRRTASLASVTDGAWIPGTWSNGTSPPLSGPASEATNVVAVRHEPDEPARQAVPDLEQAEAREPVDREPGRLLDAAGRQRVAEQEEPCERVERVVTVEPAPMDVGVDRSRGQLAGAEPLLDALGGVAGELECSPELAQATGVAAVGNRASHAAIVARTSPVGPVGRAHCQAPRAAVGVPVVGAGESAVPRVSRRRRPVRDRGPPGRPDRPSKIAAEARIPLSGRCAQLQARREDFVSSPRGDN